MFGFFCPPDPSAQAKDNSEIWGCVGVGVDDNKARVDDNNACTHTRSSVASQSFSAGMLVQTIG